MTRNQNSANQNSLKGNLLLGGTSGSAYTSSETNNIAICNAGVAAENNVLRIGTQGSGTSQQNQAFIVGPLNIAGAITTEPVDSSTATTAFGTSLTAGTAKQNTTGYDLYVNISVAVSLATGGTLVLGVGPTSTPTTNAVTGAFTTIVALPPITLSAVVPNNYYLLVNGSGVITISSILTQVCPL